LLLCLGTLHARPSLELACVQRLSETGQARLWALIRIPAQLLRYQEVQHQCQNRSEITYTLWQHHRRVAEWKTQATSLLHTVEPLPPAQQAYYYEQLLLAPPGPYLLLVSWKDQTGTYYASQLLPCSIPYPGSDGLRGSDLILSERYSYQASQLLPILGYTVPNQYERLAYYAQLYSPSSGPVTLRTILYKKQPLASSSPAQQYHSQEQYAETIYLKQGLNTLADELQTASLPSGEYLLELVVLSDAQVLWRKHKPLLLIWPGLDSALAANPAHRPIWWGSLPTRPDPWQQLATRWGGGYLALQAAYYQRLHQAEQLLGSHHSQQAQYYIQLQDPVTPKPNQWLYPHWNMVLLFGPDGQLKENLYEGL
jgi:hypothetical protein